MWALVLALVSSYFLSGFLREGLPIFWDGHSHVARSWFAQQSFIAGEFSGWTPAWYGGFYWGRFYSPLHYWVTGLIGVIVGSPVIATKLVLFLVQLLFVLLMGVAVKQLTGKKVGLLAGILFALLNPERYWVVGVIGSHPSAWLLLGFAGICYSQAKFQDHKNPYRLGMGNGLILAVMAWAHLTNTVFFGAIILVWQCSSVFFSGSSRKFQQIVRSVAVTLSIAVVACLYLIYPWLMDRSQVALTLIDDIPPNYQFSALPLKVFLGIDSYHFSQHYVYPHHWLVILLATYAGISGVNSKNKAIVGLFLPLMASFILLGLIGDRGVLAASMFLHLFAALSLVEIFKPSKCAWVMQSVTGFAIAALIFYTSNISWNPRYVLDEKLDFYTGFTDKPSHQRIFDMSMQSTYLDGIYGWSSVSPMFSDHSVAFGGFPQGAPLGSVNNTLLSGMLESSEAQLHIDAILDWFYLNNIGFLVDRDKERNFILESEEIDPINSHISRMVYSSPVLFTTELRHFKYLTERSNERANRWSRDYEIGSYPGMVHLRVSKYRNEWESLKQDLQAMNIDREHAKADYLLVGYEIPLRNLTAGSVRNGSKSQLLSYSEKFNQVDLVVEATEPQFVRLSYSYDKNLAVYVNGRRAEVIPEALLGGMLIELPAGIHNVVIRGQGLQGCRLYTLYISAICFLLSLMMFLIWIRICGDDAEKGEAE